MYFEFDMNLQALAIICITVLVVNLVECLFRDRGGDNDDKGE